MGATGRLGKSFVEVCLLNRWRQLWGDKRKFVASALRHLSVAVCRGNALLQRANINSHQLVPPAGLCSQSCSFQHLLLLSRNRVRVRLIASLDLCLCSCYGSTHLYTHQNPVSVVGAGPSRGFVAQCAASQALATGVHK